MALLESSRLGRLLLGAAEAQQSGHFLLHAGEVVARTELLEKVMDMTFDPGTNVVDVNVTRLRKKLAGAGATVAIVSRRGIGFVLKATGEGA